MLLSQAYPLSEDELNEDSDPVVSETARLERKRLLEEFPNYELSAMHSVAQFLAELVEWAGNSCCHPCSSSHFIGLLFLKHNVLCR